MNYKDMTIRERFEKIKAALKRAKLKTSIPEIAKEIGMGKVALYHWLDSDDASPSLQKLETLETWLIENGYLDSHDNTPTVVSPQEESTVLCRANLSEGNGAEAA